jgi:hypothetical protein
LDIDSWYGQDDMADSQRGAKRLILQLAVAIELVFLAFTFLATVQAEEQNMSASSGKALPTLTTANAAHSLKTDEAKLGYPVHLHAVVTYYDPDTAPTVGAFFACDQTGCICVLVPPRPVLPLRAGTVIDMKGVSKPGNYAPIVIASEVHTVGQSHLPSTAPRRSLAQLMTGADDGQWVEVEAVIHSVAQAGDHITLALALADGEIRAITTHQVGIDYAGLVDSTVVEKPADGRGPFALPVHGPIKGRGAGPRRSFFVAGAAHRYLATVRAGGQVCPSCPRAGASHTAVAWTVDLYSGWQPGTLYPHGPEDRYEAG